MAYPSEILEALDSIATCDFEAGDDFDTRAEPGKIKGESGLDQRESLPGPEKVLGSVETG